ncbi:MAG: hypothetical protein IJN41_06335 [Firmicutes bacterium]|nr:hypothetical protein [Bacillota bacterium]
MFDYLTQAIQFMEQMQKEKKQELKQLPTGSLSSQKSSKRNRLYWTHKLGSGKYAPRKTDPLREEDFHIAQGLRQRRICILQIKAYRNNLKYAKHCLAHLIPTDYASIIKQLKEPYKTLPGFEHLMSPSPQRIQSENPVFREHLIHENSIGQLFRSKSEMHISEILLKLNIPYRYEKKLTISDDTKYPDFVIKHPLTGEKKYIEYFGMTDNEDYQERMIQTINWYLNHQFIPGRTVLFLYENSNAGLKLPIVTKQIRDFLET